MALQDQRAHVREQERVIDPVILKAVAEHSSEGADFVGEDRLGAGLDHPLRELAGGFRGARQVCQLVQATDIACGPIENLIRLRPTLLVQAKHPCSGDAYPASGQGVRSDRGKESGRQAVCRVRFRVLVEPQPREGRGCGVVVHIRTVRGAGTTARRTSEHPAALPAALR